jgi:Predicted metal-dependent hydrolase of the TIM-barrel fold
VPDPESPFDLYTVFGPVPPLGGRGGIDALKQTLVRHKVGGAVVVSTRAVHADAASGNQEAADAAATATGDEVTLVPGAVVNPCSLFVDAPDLSRARLICLLPGTQNWPLPYAPVTALFASGGLPRTVPVLVETRRPGDATAVGMLLKEVGWSGGPVLLSGASGAVLTEALAVARANERVGLTTHGMRGVGEVKFAATQIGAGRVFFASGTVGESLGAGLALVKLAGLSPEERTQVLGGNARRMLGVTA